MDTSQDTFSISKRVKSFSHAIRGLFIFVRRTHNAWIQMALFVGVVDLGFYYDITRTDWILIILAAGLVFAAEAFNTAIEIDMDLTSPNPHPYARDTKDVAAGAVLLAAITAFVVGILVFYPYV